MKFLYKITIPIISLLLITNLLLAQVPTISSFSPIKGKYYDLDTINGTGFHTNVDSNFVFFGTVKATVISASATRLVVKVPRSAQSGPITLIKSGLCTKSSKWFSIIALGGNYYGDSTVLSQANYLPGVTSSAIAMENQLTTGDFNLDGEIDVAETNTTAQSRLYLNTKTYQVATAFSTFINLADSTGTKIIGSADMNNDGKYDIVSINKTRKRIYYFKNNSTASTFNLSTPFVFNLQNSPRDFNINDVNRDGKLDLIITFDTVSSGNIGTYVFLNTSTNNDTLLLASPQSIGSNFLGNKIISSDLNADGKTDFVVFPSIIGQSPDFNYISIYTNNSTSSSISFSKSFTFNSSQIHLIDFTGDGINDIASDNLYNSVLFYKNTLSGFTFQTRMDLGDFQTGINRFLDINFDGISDFLSNISSPNNVFRVFNPNIDPNSGDSKTYPYTTLINRKIELNSLVLADLDTNNTPDLISYSNGLVLTKNDYLKLPPTLTSSNITYLDLKSYKAKVKVTKGNGIKRLVILKKGAPINKLPVDYNTYLAKDSFGLGSLIETNNYVMYNGLSDTFNFVNLRRNTQYYGAVIEYNGIDSGSNYMDTAFYFDFKTPNEMSLQITNLKATEISDSSAKISWDNGDGTNRLIMVYREQAFNKEKPIKFKQYKANNIYGLGDTLLGQILTAYIVYSDTGSSFYLNGLSSSINYRLRAIEFEIRNDSIIYLEEIGPTNLSFNTLFTTPRIDSIIPIKAQPGDKVVIYGNYFDYDADKNKISYLAGPSSNITTAVTFGAVKASNFKVLNERTIEAIVPYGASNEFVRVTRKYIGDSYSPKKFQPYFLSRDTFGLGSYYESASLSRGKVDELNGISITDMNENGRPDYFFGFNNGVWYTNGVNYANYGIYFWFNSFQYSMSYQFDHNTIETNLDSDKDLKMDGIANSFNGNGTFSILGTSFYAYDSYAIGQPTLGITDFNKDGNYDRLVIRNEYVNQNYISEIGIKTSSNNYFGWGTNAGEKITAASINDFNNDCKPDILFASKITGKISLFINKYDSGFFSKNSFDTNNVILSSPIGCEKLESADIDGDGKEDFVITNSINNKLYLYKNVFNGNVLDSNSFLLTAVFSLPCTPKRVRLHDVTGDGKIDIIVLGANVLSNGLLIFQNNMVNQNMDTTQFKLYTQNHSTNFGDLKINDVNLDGKPEIIFNKSAYNVVSSTQKLFSIQPMLKNIYTANDSLYLPFSTFGRNFNSGNILKVQLLDSTGNNVIISTIGLKTSTLDTDTIPCKIPSNVLQGSYKVRIISSAPIDTSVISSYNISICGINQNLNITSTKGFNFCSNDSLILVAGTISTGNFKWYKNNQFIANTYNNSLIVKSPGLYRVTYTNSIGCQNPSNNVQVNTFTNSFSGYNYSNNLSFCVGDSINVTANSTHPNYKTMWYFNNSPLLSDTFSNLTIKQSGNYYAIIKDTNFCSWTTPAFVVNNNDYKIKMAVNKPLAFCNGDSTLLIADSLGNSGLKWKWFKNNLPLLDSNNTLKVYSTGVYKLKATNNIGCVKFSNDTQISVYPKPIVSFTINNPNQCVNGNSFTLTDSSTITTGTISRKWYLGMDINDTSLLASIVKVYPTANTYSVKLVETSNNGCKDSLIKTIVVFPNPKAGFTINKSSQCLYNNNFIFTDTTSNLTSLWNTGINNNQTTKIVNQSYNSIGDYTIKLVVKSINNCLDSTSKTIAVNPHPTAGFTINNPVQCVNGNSFLFADTSKVIAGTLSRKWNFGVNGNDTSILLNPSKSYATANTYSVKLIASSNNNCKDSIIKTVTVNPKPSSNFTINKSTQCLKYNNFIFTNQSTLGVNFLWKFDNGDSSVNISPNYSYTSIGTKAVKLIVSDNNNCKDSITKNVVVNANSIANFTINNDTQNFVGNNFVFTNTSNNSSSQLWNFGDSTSATISNPNKTYSSFGTKIVQLISNNVSNCYDTISKNIFVNAHPTIGNILGNINPTSTINPYSYSVLSQSNIVYNWSIQNGVIQSGQGTNAVSVIWSKKGTGNIFAKITNNYNLSDSTNLAVNITTVGINNIAINNFSQIHIKPNPFSTNLEINFTSATKESTRLIITDAIGKEVYEQNFQTNIGDNNLITEDLSTLKPGFYMATLANNNGQSKAFKVLKN